MSSVCLDFTRVKKPVAKLELLPEDFRFPIYGSVSRHNRRRYWIDKETGRVFCQSLRSLKWDEITEGEI